MKILDNAYLKIFSVIFAFTIWFYVQGKDIVETAIKYTVVFSNVPADLYVEDVLVPEIVVWVKVPKHMLNTLLKGERKLDFSLKNAVKGKNSLQVQHESLDLPRIFEIVKIEPEKLTVRLSGYIQKRVKVLPDYQGSKEYSMEPRYVMVKGERKAVEALRELVTESIDDSGRHREITVRIVNPGDNIHLSPDRVKVIFK